MSVKVAVLPISRDLCKVELCATHRCGSQHEQSSAYSTRYWFSEHCGSLSPAWVEGGPGLRPLHRTGIMHYSRNGRSLIRQQASRSLSTSGRRCCFSRTSFTWEKNITIGFISMPH